MSNRRDIDLAIADAMAAGFNTSIVSSSSFSSTRMRSALM